MMISPLPWQLMEQWSRSVDETFQSVLQISGMAAEVIDESTFGQINEFKRRFIDAMPYRGSHSPSAIRPHVALVTGGTGGIGTEICKKLADAGNRVIATYVAAEAEHARQWRQERLAEGKDITILQCDVTDFDDCVRLAREVESRHGGVDILVNGAGITRDNTLRKMEVEHWHAVLDTNLDSVFNVTKNFIEGMAERGYGRIINISSVNGQKGQVGQTNYSAAKAGITGFTRSLARELADQGITVNAVSPGYVATRMVMAVPEDVRNQIIAKIPVGRLAEPAEIAHAVAFLADQQSGYITGSDLSINGGLYMS